MSIRFACPSCSRMYIVDPTRAGKSGRCKECGTPMKVPAKSGPGSGAPRGPSAVDLYGLEEPASPAPRAGVVADADERPPLRRARPAAASHKSGRGEPWNLPLRGAAIKASILFVAIGGLSVALMSRGGDSRLQTIGALGLVVAALVGLVAIPLTWISVLGAGVSLIRGNPRAFSGGGPGEQTAWGATVLIGLCGTALLIGSLPTAIRSAQRAAMRHDGASASPGGFLGGSGGGTSDADTLSNYERPIANRIAANDRFADLFQEAPLPGDPRGFGYFDGITGLEMIHLETEHSLEVAAGFRPPSEAQVATIRKNLAGPLAASFRRVAGAMRAATERIRSGPESPTRTAAMEDVQDWLSRAERIAGHLEDPALDDKSWYAHASSPGFEGRPFAYATYEIPTREQVIARQERTRALEAAMRHVLPRPSP